MEQDRKIDYRYNFKIYWNFLKKYKGLVIITLLATTFAQSLPIIEKLIFKVIVDKGTEFGAGTFSRAAYIDVLLLMAGIFVGIAIVRAIASWVKIHYLSILVGNMILDVKRKYFDHILELSHQFHTSHSTGQLISRLIKGRNAIEGFTDVIIFNFAPLLIKILTAIAVLAFFDLFSAFVFIAIAIVFVTYSLIIYQFQKVHTVIANETEDSEKASIADMLINIDSIKYFGKEKYVQSRINNLGKNTRAKQIKSWNYYRWSDSGQSIILYFGTILVFLFPLLRFLNGEITIGTVVFVYTAYYSFSGSFWSFIHGVRSYYRHMADFQVLFEYGKIENDIKDRHDAKIMKISKGNVEFRDVDFSYPKRNVLFKGFNLKIGKNKKVALVGRSGSGKSTLIKLLYRLYDLQGGEVLIDGKNIANYKQKSLRSELSIVPQECILFDDTLWSNIAFSSPHASKKDIWHAIKAAQLLELVQSLPDKEHTLVGERGVRLSGGEKQRVSIARAILADKKILVLDEATASMDSETEMKIQAALKELMKGRTTIIVAHRLSTIMGADKIIVFEQGKIVESGKHTELIRKKGQYKKLWNLQKGGYIK